MTKETVNSTAFDLSTLDTSQAAESGAMLTLRHPVNNQPITDEAGNDVTITVVGQDSRTFKKAQQAITNRRLAMRRGQRVTAEELDAEGIELLSRCTVKWTGIALDGEPLPCTPSNARKLYDRLPWVREQVDEFIADRANFLKG